MNGLKVFDLINSKNIEDDFVGCKLLEEDKQFWEFAASSLSEIGVSNLKHLLHYLQPNYINKFCISSPIIHIHFSKSRLKYIVYKYETIGTNQN